MEKIKLTCFYSPSIPGSCSIVAPYAANVNAQLAGIVQYTGFNVYLSTDSSMSTVSRFVRNQTGDNFNGNKMMVAEWDGVAQLNGASVSLQDYIWEHVIE